MATAKKTNPRSPFKTGEYIVYPAHGVGRIVGLDTQEVAGIKLDLFVISFIKDKMTLRVPTKATAVACAARDQPTVKRASDDARPRRIQRICGAAARIRARSIREPDPIAEVVRDLFRSENQPEQSYSERQLYEAALDRMSREISSVNRISETEAVRQIEQNLAKSPRRGAKGAEAAPAREQAA
jgi:CarD family transcriptional regulator